jgi:predicted amidophosphoribosyltransferase
MFDDQTLLCRDCGASFDFTAGEQAFYERKGFESAPSRCPDCRKTEHRGGSGYSAGRYTGGDARGADAGGRPDRPEQLFPAACSQCGGDTQASARLIFGDGTIYCPDCIPPAPEGAASPNGGWHESW